MSDDYPLGADCDIDAMPHMPCRMRQQYPYDFAWCEVHDETFPLGGICKYFRHEQESGGTPSTNSAPPEPPSKEFT